MEDTREIVFAVVVLLGICGLILAQSDIIFEADDDVSEETPCRCEQIRRCRPLMARPNWKEILPSMRPCGYRRICCPKRLNVPGTKPVDPKDRPRPIRPIRPIRPPVTPSLPEITTEPTSITRVNVVTAPKIKACGQSMIIPDETANESDVLEGLIVGGENATQGEFPWMVAINILEREFVPHCTGFLIDNIHVLTAAHCFDDSRDPSMFIAKIGHILQSEATTYHIRKIAAHEGYTEGKYYDDIAVMTLTEPVREPHVVPLCLPTDDIIRTNLTGKGVTVAGWGSEKYRGELTNHLKKLEHVPVISNRECNRILRRALAHSFTSDFPKGITQGFICAGFKEANKDSCGGDSGGPLMLHRRNTYYAVGVVSFGIGCGRPGVPAGYTKVSSQMNWIVENTRD